MATDKIQMNYDYALFLDIETSKIKCDNGEYIQATYLSNILVVDMIAQEIKESHFFRTMADTIQFLNEFSVFEKYICFAHNLDYELFHILRDTEGNGIKGDKIDIYNMEQGLSIFRDKNAPLSIWLQEIPNINFRDTYALFNKSVKTLGEEIGLKKLEYDYKITRTCRSVLWELDYDYNERDNIIVARSLFNRMKQRGETLKDLPLTFTATTKIDRYKFIKEHFGKGELKALNIDNANMYNTYDFYRMCVQAYQGGITTANKNYFNKPILNSIMSIDITSSYPYQMATRRFPLYTKENVNHFVGDEADEFYSLILHGLSIEEMRRETPIRGFYATVEIYNIEIKNDNYLLGLSASNTHYITGETNVNGKVLKAEKIIMTVDNVTLDWINKCYYYDDIVVTELITTTKDRYLRLGEISFILNNFRIKQTMKGVAGEELNYALAKVNINNMYGVKVQKPLKDRYEILNGEVIKMECKDSYLFDISTEEIYNNFIKIKEEQHFKMLTGKNFDIFSDGVYITAYARHMLLSMMIELTNNNCTCVYTDTDSLKFICNDIKSIQNVLERINGEIIEKNVNLYRFKEFKEKFNVNDKDFKEVCKLGTWDIENAIDENGNVILYKYFKTMGAKKYAYVDDNIHTTIAGCSKKVAKTIEKYCQINKIDYITGVDEIFSVGTQFDETCSGRTVSYRENRSYEEVATYTYKGLPIFSNGGIIIEDTSYTLNISRSDEELLDIRREQDVIRILNSKGELKYV